MICIQHKGMIIVKNLVFPLPVKTEIKYIEVLTISYDN